MPAGKLLISASLAILLAMNEPASAGPGAPLAGAGCVPLGARQLGCERVIANGLVLASKALAKCHETQANAAFAGRAFDEEACEARAASKLTRTFRPVCDPEVLRATAALRSDIENFLDTTVNGTLFCDATSGIPIDPGGDDAGFVPATTRALRCGITVGKQLFGGPFGLSNGLIGCVIGAARTGLRDKPFDETACRTVLRRRYDRSAAVSVARGCPACLASGQPSLADQVVAFVEARRGQLFACLTGFFLRSPGFSLELTPPVTSVFSRERAPRLDVDQTGTFPTFITAPLAADTVLSSSGLVVLHLAANQDMIACADVAITLERVAGDDSRTAIGAALHTNVTLPQADANPSRPLGFDIILDDPNLPAGNKLAATVAVTNRCSANRGVSLDYDGSSAPSRIVVQPAAP